MVYPRKLGNKRYKLSNRVGGKTIKEAASGLQYSAHLITDHPLGPLGVC